MRILEEKGVMLFLGEYEFSLFIRRSNNSSLWRHYAGKVIEQEDGSSFLLEVDGSTDPIFNLKLRVLRGGLYSLKMGRDYYILSPRRENIVRKIRNIFRKERRRG